MAMAIDTDVVGKDVDGNIFAPGEVHPFVVDDSQAEEHVATTRTEQETVGGPQEDESIDPEERKYKRKYLTLKRRCEQIENGNGKAANRLFHVKKAIRKLKRERKSLMSKLDGYGDNYCNVPLTLPPPIHDSTTTGTYKSD